MRRVALASAALAFCLPAQWVGGASAAVACLTAATGRRLGASARVGVAIVASATRLDSTLSQELPHARWREAWRMQRAAMLASPRANATVLAADSPHRLLKKHSDECGTGDVWQAGHDAVIGCCVPTGLMWTYSLLSTSSGVAWAGRGDRRREPDRGAIRCLIHVATPCR